MMNAEAIAEIAEILSLSIEDAEQIAPLLKQRFGNESTDAPKEQEEVVVNDEQDVTAKPSKIKCKVCGFYKKPKKVLRETGCCAVCTQAISDGGADGTVEVIGRMGKRGRNTVSIVRDGQRFRVKRLSNRHSEKVAARFAAKPKGYAKRAKRTGSAPAGLRTDSRIGGDREQRTPEA